MPEHAIVSREDWLQSRRELLEKEKAFTREREHLSKMRRDMPWVRVDKNYQFDGEGGQTNLAELFGANSQLIVFHFMFGQDWDEGCPSCSFWADNFDGIDIHLQHRDAKLVVISNSALDKLLAYRQRMGWSFDWYSAAATDFNQDYNVSFTAEQMASGDFTYNYKAGAGHGPESPGTSIFKKEADGSIYHTYSCYARGLDILNGAYHFMDMLPKGRDEDDLPFTMAWLKRNDQY